MLSSRFAMQPQVALVGKLANFGAAGGMELAMLEFHKKLHRK